MNRPAPIGRAIAALAALELQLTARRGENVLVTLVIPVAVLWFFATIALIPGVPNHPVAFLLPGALALAIVAAGLVNLGIATAYERSYGVLKRLGGAPVPRWVLLASKAASIAVLEVVQLVVLLVVGAALGWQPGPGWSPVLLVVALILGTFAFAGLGLLLAGTLRAEATLALANALFLGFLMIGGIVLPVAQLPEVIQPIAALLPSAALAELLNVALNGSAAAAAAGQTALRDPTIALGILAIWAVIASVLAATRFRWE